jgi:HSP20 family molecular chaperone IbpA
MSDKEKDGPVGLEALNEMGRRLLDVVGSVEHSFRGDQIARTRSFWVKTPRGRLAGSIGFSMRRGIVPEQPERTPTRSHAPAPQPKIDDFDRQLIDVFDEPGEILVTIAPCAVSRHELAVRVEGAELYIEATGGSRFRKQVRLPRDLGDAVPALRLSNGILEIRIAKPADPVPQPSN